MNIETARHIAARIWCDKEYEHVEMNGDLAEQIAQMLMDNDYNAIHTYGEKCPNCVNGHFYKTIDHCKCGYERRR